MPTDGYIAKRSIINRYDNSQTSGSSGDGNRRSSIHRYRALGISVLAAFGVFAAIGTNIVNSVFPDIAERVGGTDPLRINVREDPQGSGDGFTLATASARGLDARLENVDSCETLFTAGKRAGAVDVDKSILDLLLEGGTRHGLTIVDMHAKILKRRPSLSGAEIFCQSAGALGAIPVAFDLDESNPVARRGGHTGVAGPPYFQNGNVVVLKQGDIQPFQVVATTADSYVAWELILDVVVDGESQTIHIDDHGQPFELTGPLGQTKYERRYEWVWWEQPQRLEISSPNGG